MAEIGIQVWQGVLPENDIPALQRHLNGRLTLMGGFGAAIDRKDAAPEEILTYARGVLRHDCPGGHFIPSITYGLAGTVYPHVDTYLNQAVDEYNAALHVPDMHLPPVPRRSVHAAAAQSAPASEPEQPQGDVFARIAAALVRGQQKRVLQLCTEALDAGHDAQQILTDGLVRGMNLLGEDFSANRAFVPEMLIAARCMAAATELLKPHMAGESGETVGRVCLGTVRGDMHDIGKNLVKIMMEGSGLEVVDLGVDVSAEQFVDAAVAQHCDIIACSSLLTTTMPEMRAVVELTKARGIRDQVKIFVGGAPITQGTATRSARMPIARMLHRRRAQRSRCCAVHKRKCGARRCRLAHRRALFLPGMREFVEMDREKTKVPVCFRFLNNCFLVPRDL